MTSKIVRVALVAAIAAASLSVAACQPKPTDGADASASPEATMDASTEMSADTMASDVASS